MGTGHPFEEFDQLLAVGFVERGERFGVGDRETLRHEFAGVSGEVQRVTACRAAHVLPAVRDIAGVPPRPFDAWALDHAKAFAAA